MSKLNSNPKNNGHANGQKDQLSNAWGYFLPVPEALVEALPEIGPNAFTLATYLLSRCYSGKRKAGDFTSWPSYETIAADTGMGNRAISSAIKRLEKAGFLEREKQTNHNTRYTLKPRTESPVVAKRDDPHTVATAVFAKREDHIRETRDESIQRVNLEKPLNKEDLVNNNNDPEALLLTELKALKLPNPWIKNQLQKHGPERLRAVLQYAQAEAETIDNPGGWIRTAIEQEYELEQTPKPSRIKRRQTGISSEEYYKAWESEPDFWDHPEPNGAN